MQQKLFDQNVKVSKQPNAQGKTNENGSKNVFVIVVHGSTLFHAFKRDLVNFHCLNNTEANDLIKAMRLGLIQCLPRIVSIKPLGSLCIFALNN